MPKRLALFVCLVSVALLSTELSLRMAGSALRWMSPSSAGPPERLRAFRILCIGDSNTYGVGVPRDKTYPAELERLLNADPGGRRFEVVNLGVPGTNSGQVLRRLPQYVEAYRPDHVVVVIGVNDYWNPSDMNLAPAASLGAQLHRWASHLRTYRLVLLTLEGFGQDMPPTPDGDVSLNLLQQRGQGGGEGDATVWQVQDGEFKTMFRNPARSALLDDNEHEAVLRGNLEKIVRIAAARGIPLTLATYAANIGHYAVANRAMRAVAGAQVVQLNLAAARSALPKSTSGKQELFFSDLHPKAPVYTLFAENLRNALVERGLLPGRP